MREPNRGRWFTVGTPKGSRVLSEEILMSIIVNLMLQTVSYTKEENL